MYSSDEYLSLVGRACRNFIDSPDYKKIVDILIDCYEHKGTVFTMGCGGSASTATHFAADLAKTVGGFKTVSLVDNIPLVSAWTNDFGWDTIFEGQLRSWWVKRHDVLVGFSVHGGNSKWSGNLAKGMRLMKDRKARVIGFSGFDGGELKKGADACLVVPTGELYGTPLVEAMHVVLAHGIIFELRQRLNNIPEQVK
jgi:D-sedoheptulose 7-phosphate isomerase